MRDSEVVAAIVAGDPTGLAEAYDRYAAPLFAYCRSLLREPADAADAVQDTFVIAASKLAGLRDTNRLRAWLYAVARNECLRRLREAASAAASALDAAREVSDESADVTEGAERAELRALLRSAIGGLSESEQDLIELQLRQELDVAEIAAVLGVSRNHAHALLSRARDQLEKSLGALLVARSGREDCPALGALLQDWDGQLTVLMRKRINRHIERCPACAERKRRELAPALLLGVAPLAAVAMPPGLREQVLRLAGGHAPEAVAYRAAVAQHAASFGPEGFPKAAGAPAPRWRPGRAQALVAAAAAAVMVAAVVTALALSGGAGPGRLSGTAGGTAAAGAGPGGSITGGSGPGGSGPGGSGPGGQPTAAPATGAAGGPASPGAGGSPGAGIAPAPAGTAPGGTAPGGTAPGGTAPGGTAPGGTAPAGGGPGYGPSSPSTPTSPAPSSAPASSPGPAPTHSPTPRPTPRPTTSSSPAPSPGSSSSPPPAAGTLSVTPAEVQLSAGLSGSVTLRDSGAPVTWSVIKSGALGTVTVTPSSGTLGPGQAVTVSLRVLTLASLDRPAGRTVLAGQNPCSSTVTGVLTVNPGGHQVTVVVSSRCPSPSPCPGNTQGGGDGQAGPGTLAGTVALASMLTVTWLPRPGRRRKGRGRRG